MKLIIDGKECTFCPQHGYPLPCYKCGLGQYELGKQTGIKEVVEWINKQELRIPSEYETISGEKVVVYLALYPSVGWQSKLKEWGVF